MFPVHEIVWYRSRIKEYLGFFFKLFASSSINHTLRTLHIAWNNYLYNFPKQQKMRGHPGSNQGPLDLQSNALPLSYIPYSPSLLQKCVHLYWDGTSCSNNMCVHFCTQKYVLYFSGSLAQWLEHWSCKPGVGGSIPPRALHFCVYSTATRRQLANDDASVSVIHQGL